MFSKFFVKKSRLVLFILLLWLSPVFSQEASLSQSPLSENLDILENYLSQLEMNAQLSQTQIQDLENRLNIVNSLLENSEESLGISKEQLERSENLTMSLSEHLKMSEESLKKSELKSQHLKTGLIISGITNVVLSILLIPLILLFL